MQPETIPALSELKAQAKRLRNQLGQNGTPISHSQSLELLARQYGQRDWNTLYALAGNGPPPVPISVGANVSGRYLGQAFTARVLGLQQLGPDGHYTVTLHLDTAVDVVTFDSFSAFRQRVTGTIDANGISPRKTSNGLPQLVLDI